MTIRRLILQAPVISRRQLHVISRSTTNIKPASPTPLQLKHYKLPLHDRMMPDFNIPLIFFYPNPQPSNKTTLSNLLKNSLSKTLSEYYPFAGTLGSEGSYVECNDEGVHFVEARIEGKLLEIMEKAPVKDEKEGYGHLFPPCSVWHKAFNSPLMFVQVNHFSCGGIAIAVSLSHRVADGTTLFSFLTYWASLTRNSSNEDKLVDLRPCFVHDLLPGSFDDDLAAYQRLFPEKHWITREITFHNSKIAQLTADQEFKDKVHGVVGDQNYTRNELVTAVLFRCAVVAATTSNSGAFQKSVLVQVVNMRPLIHPPLPKTSVGNLISTYPVLTSTMSETELNPLVCQMRKEKMELIRGNEIVPLNFDLLLHHVLCKPYVFSSICNFPLYEEMDFGWGRPAKATLVDTPFVNIIFMMDTPSRDGIKAIVALEEEDMENFLDDKELRTYASV